MEISKVLMNRAFEISIIQNQKSKNRVKNDNNSQQQLGFEINK